MLHSSKDKANLEKRYRKLMEESFKLSRTNRKKSDEKMAEAEEIQRQIVQTDNNA